MINKLINRTAQGLGTLLFRICKKLERVYAMTAELPDFRNARFRSKTGEYKFISFNPVTSYHTGKFYMTAEFEKRNLATAWLGLRTAERLIELSREQDDTEEIREIFAEGLCARGDMRK